MVDELKEFICDIEFKTFLPKPTLPPKRISIPVRKDFLAEFTGTTLEYLTKPEILSKIVTEVDFNKEFHSETLKNEVFADVSDFDDEQLSPDDLSDREYEILFERERESKSTTKNEVCISRDPSNKNISENDKNVGLIRQESENMKTNEEGFINDSKKASQTSQTLSDEKPFIVSSKPIYFSDFTHKNLVRVLFDNDTKIEKASENNEDLIMYKDEESLVLYSRERKGHKEQEEKKIEGTHSAISDLIQCNDGSQPPHTRRNVLLVCETHAEFVVLKGEFRMKAKMTPESNSSHNSVKRIKVQKESE